MKLFKRIAASLRADPSMDVTPPPPKPFEPEGLQKRWFVGKQLPWEGIWFEVSDVQAESITLKPIGTTWKRHKQITGRK